MRVLLGRSLVPGLLEPVLDDLEDPVDVAPRRVGDGDAHVADAEVGGCDASGKERRVSWEAKGRVRWRRTLDVLVQSGGHDDPFGKQLRQAGDDDGWKRVSKTAGGTQRVDLDSRKT